MNKTLDGKTALVTGGSRGLGRATAEDLAERGALVAINYASNDQAARETLLAIEAKGGKAFLIKGAQGSYEAAVELAKALDVEFIARTGSNELDILVNNAGGGPIHTMDTTTPDIFDKVLGDNLRGPFFVTKVLKSQLRQGGRVIFVSSLGARNALPQYIVYSITKSAVETLTVVMAKELGPRGITVNCITPGLIESDSNADLRADAATFSHVKQLIPLGRIGAPTDFSGVVLSLVSPQMSYVTGQLIEIAGGMSL